MKNCYHCNNPCEEEIVFDQKTFCCEGCRTVYEILSSNKLDGYYTLNENPGVRTESARGGKYNYLDLDDIKSKLLLFSEEGISKVRLSLPQIHCSSCLWLLERLHKLNPGVISSQVNFVDKEAEITFKDQEVSLKQLAELLSAIGYPPDISLSAYDEEKTKKRNNRLIIQIGIAGFCFGNIMLLSFPEYLGIDESFKDFQNTFNYLNLALSIPVLVFGARDYIVSSFKALRSKQVNIDVPITLGIFALYIRSLYEVISGTGAGYFDSFAGLIFFLLIGKWFQQQTYTAINFERDYKSYFPIATSRKNGEEEEIVPLKQIKVGDRLIIRNNELIPADALLVEGSGRIDYSFVSGESTPISKKIGDKIFAGGRQTGATLEIEVIKDVENSYLTRLWNNPVFHRKKKFAGISDNISKYFTLLILLISLIAGIVWLQIDASRAPFIITSILIVACPCAIALSVPFTFGNVIRQLGRRALYLRSTEVIEPINEVTDVIFDKTGTLTLSDQVNVSWEGEALTNDQLNAVYSITYQSAHPLSRSISNFLSNRATKVDVSELSELPGKGISAKIGDQQIRVGSASWLNVSSDTLQTRVFVELNGIVLGSFVFGNSYRKGLKELFEQMNSRFKLHVLSGDNDSEKERLVEMFGSNVDMQFNQSPEDKLSYISNLQDQGKTVMMLGDGLNDAGALKQADVGIAVVDDVYAFSPSSDAIMDGKKIDQLLHYLNYSAFGIKVVWLSYGFSILYNSIGMYFALTGQLTPLVAAILMPLSSISVVLLVTLLTTLKARSLN
ncbi:MAG: heavy metal translocating P-type ATPase metal-binding domain-containing protein [Crocinitomicaceae bacterium]|nr:heavy metal translocating P-type ATPase metal-binding domain-containing protein [Crocinitomicaceae bacterium]